jgi:hypothetical protein
VDEKLTLSRIMESGASLYDVLGPAAREYGVVTVLVRASESVQPFPEAFLRGGFTFS